MWCRVSAVVGTWPDVTYRSELAFLLRGPVLMQESPMDVLPREIYAIVRNSPDRPEGEREGLPRDDDIWAAAASGLAFGHALAVARIASN
jgi:hypothetical protein